MHNNITSAVVCAETGLSHPAVLLHLHAGNLPAYRLGKMFVIDRADLEEFKIRHARGDFDGRRDRWKNR